MTTQERDAWTFAYRLYDEYAPKLKQAAALDDDNETAGQLFLAALERIKPHFTNDGNDANWILLGVYDILDYVFKEAQKHARTGQEQARTGDNRTGDKPARITA